MLGLWYILLCVIIIIYIVQVDALVPFSNTHIKYSLIPQTIVPLNTSDCMCQSIERIVTNAVNAPVEVNCTSNIECIGLQCVFIVTNVHYTIETEALACTDPPGIVFIVKSTSNGAIIFDEFFNSSASTFLFGLPMDVVLIHRPYSMFVQVCTLIAYNDSNYCL